jgi:dihydroorotate dehydrogenase
MVSLPFDPYPYLRPLLFRLDAEKAHGLAIEALKRGLVPKVTVSTDAVLRSRLCGIDLDHPIGLAAGFDKQAEIIGHCFHMGFSFAELGGVTPLPQPGNPQPRLFRIEESGAVINRFGFNSVGADIFLRRLVAFHDTQTRTKRHIIGINLAKNKETVDAADDYVKGVQHFARHADFLTVNVSSPNTPGLRDMQERGALTDLLHKTMQARSATGKNPKLFLKIAPDITDAQAADIADVAMASGIDGMTIGNTTTSRPATITSSVGRETGGLSGKPLFELSTKVLGDMYRLTGGKIPLIGCGGISSAANAYAKIRAGASAVQLYTALVYEGPQLLARLTTELAALLKGGGFATVSEAVGADHRAADQKVRA